MRRLVAGGFTELKEKETWKIQPLGKVQLLNTDVYNDYHLYNKRGGTDSYCIYASILKL